MWTSKLLLMPTALWLLVAVYCFFTARRGGHSHWQSNLFYSLVWPCLMLLVLGWWVQDLWKNRKGKSHVAM